jgi:hypothetical protein
MYIIEVEIALDSGRPMCIRNSDIDVEWPVEVNDDVKLPYLQMLRPESHGGPDCHGWANWAIESQLSHCLDSIFPNHPKSFESGISSTEEVS